jgi:hypothetical protein
MLDERTVSEMLCYNSSHKAYPREDFISSSRREYLEYYKSIEIKNNLTTANSNAKETKYRDKLPKLQNAQKIVDFTGLK